MEGSVRRSGVEEHRGGVTRMQLVAERGVQVPSNLAAYRSCGGCSEREREGGDGDDVGGSG